MLKLEESIGVQKNLSELCSDRDLETNEIFIGNSYYGFDKIIKLYSGLPLSYQLKAVLPHGVYLDHNYMWEAEKSAKLPAILCYPPYRESIYRKETNKKIILSASPFTYLVEMMKSQSSLRRQGTIFFPYHSTHHINVHMDYERLAKELCKLGDEFNPITVCIYWKDFNLGAHIPFLNSGMKVVSAGHIYDNEFLFRFFHLCSLHRYAAGNGLGSHIFYSVKSGCSYFHFDLVDYELGADEDTIERDAGIVPPIRENELKKFFQYPNKESTIDQLKVVDYYLGMDFFKSRNELYRELQQVEKMDKVSFFTYYRGSYPKLFLPTWCMRMIIQFRLNLLQLSRDFRKIILNIFCSDKIY